MKAKHFDTELPMKRAKTKLMEDESPWHQSFYFG